MIVCRVMSNKPGRNDPCPCGSGKKYKRCCLQTEEAAARERARQQALFDDDDLYGDAELEEDDDDEEFVYVDDDMPPLDLRAITRARYTRGFVGELSDLRSGRGLRVTEWEAPAIPAAILDSIEQEAADELEGEWGDPEAGDPMQVDLIDLETEADVVSIEVFNRAIALVHADGEDMQRIHRVCGALEGATSGGPDLPEVQSERKTTFTVFRREAVRPPADEFDLSDVLKEHRRQGGACALCGDALADRVESRPKSTRQFTVCAEGSGP
jgi:SEC-C motif